jgi:hypothetical protein
MLFRLFFHFIGEIMKKLIALAVVIMLSTAAFCQENRAEIFGGYSFTNEGLSPSLKPVGLDRVNAHGWDTSFAYVVKKEFAIKADFAGAYSKLETLGVNLGDLSVHTFLFGPLFTIPAGDRVVPFVHALFGVAHGKFTPSSLVSTAAADAGFGSLEASDNVFAMKLGGGFDVKVHKKVAWRTEIGLVHTRFDLGDTTSQNHFRLSTGIVLKF